MPTYLIVHVGISMLPNSCRNEICSCLEQVPKEQWLCPICTVMLHKGQTLFSHQTEVEKAKLSQMPQPEVSQRVGSRAGYLESTSIAAGRTMAMILS